MTLIAVLVVSSMGLLVTDGSSADPAGEIQDTGSFRSLTVTLVFSGSNADVVTWSFSDDDYETIYTGFSISHTFPEPGTYQFKQVATRNATDELEEESSTAYYSVTVLGYPEVTYRYGVPGISDVTVSQSKYNVAAEFPPTPSYGGHTLIGWFTDEGRNTPYGGTGITDDIELFALWVDGVEDEQHVLVTFVTEADTSYMIVARGTSVADVLPNSYAWFNDSELKSLVDDSDSIDGPMTFYGKLSAHNTSDHIIDKDVGTLIIGVVGVIMVLGGIVASRFGVSAVGFGILIFAAIVRAGVIAWYL